MLRVFRPKDQVFSQAEGSGVQAEGSITCPSGHHQGEASGVQAEGCSGRRLRCSVMGPHQGWPKAQVFSQAEGSGVQAEGSITCPSGKTIIPGAGTDKWNKTHYKTMIPKMMMDPLPLDGSTPTGFEERSMKQRNRAHPLLLLSFMIGL